eukprot:1150589-Pelagomonas_calceolata.AAC.4
MQTGHEECLICKRRADSGLMVSERDAGAQPSLNPQRCSLSPLHKFVTMSRPPLPGLQPFTPAKIATTYCPLAWLAGAAAPQCAICTPVKQFFQRQPVAKATVPDMQAHGVFFFSYELIYPEIHTCMALEGACHAGTAYSFLSYVKA